MKHVFNDISQVAHLWANELQNNARNSGNGNFYFEGKTIYSYGSHFPIAKHVENGNGEKAVLLTERGYSNTTSKHISVVRYAVNHKNVIYCYNPHSTMEENFDSWKTEVESIASNLPKAKKPEKYLNQIEDVKNRAKKYADFFNVPVPESLQLALSITDKNTYKEYADKKETLRIESERKAKKDLAKRHKKELKEWIAGKNNRLYTRNGFDYLRVFSDNVETSQGVKLSIPVAMRIYDRLKNNNLKVGDKVLDFEVLKINGEVAIGCHHFKKSYMLEFGEKLAMHVK